MSTRVSLCHGSPDGLLTHFLSGPLDDALRWATTWHADDPVGITAPTVTLLDRVAREGLVALKDASHSDPAVVDTVLQVYYGVYADVHPVLEWAVESWLRVHWYRDLATRLQASGNQRLGALVGVIVTGRPVLRDPRTLPFQSADGIFRVAWWTAAEVELMHAQFSAVPVDVQRALDPDWGALPNVMDAVEAAVERHSGVITIVS